MQYKLIVVALTSVLAMGVSAMPAPEAAPNAVAAPEAAPEVLEHAPLEARSEMSQLESAQKAYIQATLAYAAQAKEFKNNNGLQKLKQQKHQKRAEQANQAAECYNCGGAEGFYAGDNGLRAGGNARESGSGVGISLLGIPLLGLNAQNYDGTKFYDTYADNQFGGSS